MVGAKNLAANMKQKIYYVYMMTNAGNNALYIGVTNDLERRVWEHKTSVIPGFTAKYKCTKLVFYEETDDIGEAITREKELKGWTRKKKNALVELENPTWRDLAEDWFDIPEEQDPSKTQDDKKSGTINPR